MHGVYYILEPSLGRASAAFWAAVVVALIATAGAMIGWVRMVNVELLLRAQLAA